MHASELLPRYEFARQVANEAGRLTLDYYQRDDLAVEFKGDSSPVTVADRGAEELLRKRIAAEFPEDAILGEEFGEQPGTSGYRWILDPIDGTKSFVHGVPLYGTLVAVEHQQRSVIGVIEIPALKECVYAAAGQGTWHVRSGEPPRRAEVSQCDRLADALVLTSEAYCRLPSRHEAIGQIQQAAHINRTWGDCYGYLLVATGRAEVMIDPIMALWDVAALQPILEEAGGSLTNWHGNPTIYSSEAVATNGRVMEEVLAFTRGA
ncbi:MAG: histidinol-phosphatase [Planctomycetota bacterium]|nr:MAG: histidinol-phosphatase [Planctomycetota bacterium]